MVIFADGKTRLQRISAFVKIYVLVLFRFIFFHFLRVNIVATSLCLLLFCVAFLGKQSEARIYLCGGVLVFAGSVFQ